MGENQKAGAFILIFFLDKKSVRATHTQSVVGVNMSFSVFYVRFDTKNENEKTRKQKKRHFSHGYDPVAEYQQCVADSGR
jgi:hypothetical protein